MRRKQKKSDKLFLCGSGGLKDGQAAGGLPKFFGQTFIFSFQKSEKGGS
jgi:hypothetical protein